MISKMIRKIFLLPLFLTCFLLLLIPPVRANNGEVIVSNIAMISPTIDGSLVDEWEDAHHNLITLVGVGEITPVDIFVKNDGGSLYLALRIPDSSMNDLLVLRFQGEEGPWDAKMSQASQEPWDMYWDGDSWEFDSSMIDVLVEWGWHTDHWIVEWKIPLKSSDLHDMRVNAGETIKLGIQYGDTSSYIYPSQYNSEDPNTWATLDTTPALTKLPSLSSQVVGITPVIDGILETGWKEAYHHEIALHGSDNTTLISIQVYIMNNKDFLYFGFWIPDITPSPGDVLSLLFDQGVAGNDYDGVLTVNNEDGKSWSNAQSFQDFFYTGIEWSVDFTAGGTVDGRASGAWSDDHWEIEFEVPLSSGDPFDLDITTGNIVGLFIQYREEESSLLYSYPQGVDANKAWSWCDLLTPLYVEIDHSYVRETRIDVDTVQTTVFHATWANNGSDVTNGRLYINGTESITNGTGWAIISDYSSIVQKKTWYVSAVNCTGITLYLQTTENPIIIWDRVHLTLNGHANRIDVGSEIAIDFVGEYEFDGSLFEGSIVLNDTTTQVNVGKFAYTVDEITDPKYGLTAFISNSVEYIFDRVNVLLSVDDSRIDLATNATISWLGVYEYDDTLFLGSMTLNDTQTSYTTVDCRGYRVGSIVDPSYGLTVFTSNSIAVIFDEIHITLSIASTRISVGTNASIHWMGVYAYDNSSFSGSITLNSTQTLYQTIGKRGFSVHSVSDSIYNLTHYTSNAIFCIWDQIKIIEGGVTWYTIWYKAVTEYDGNAIDVLKGTLYANGNPMAWSNDRNRWEYTVWLPIEVKITDVDYFESELMLINDTVGALVVPIWMQWWFLSTISTTIVLVLVLYFLIIYPQKKKNQLPKPPSTENPPTV
jgi:hypothetical protein